MTIQTREQLARKKCVPCEGGVRPFQPEESASQLERLEGWMLTGDGQRIYKQWTLKNFMSAIRFFNAIAEVAEDEGHHPDLHLEEYRVVTVEIWTHAIGGLSENDFILAAKIDELPVELKPAK